MVPLTPQESYLSLLPLFTDEAADVRVEEGEGLGEQGAHIGDPHQEDRHTEGCVDHCHNTAPFSLRSYISIS